MPRKARCYQLQVSLVYHIINRGVIGQDIFHCQQDADKFRSIIQRYGKRFDFKVYHWCLMRNHYHLVMQMASPKELSKVAGAIQQIYAGYHHYRYGSMGQLFQSRFKSQAIDTAAYLLQCGRYIERNPLRAGLVQSPWEWLWSSARYYVLGEKDNLTQCNPEWEGRRNTSREYAQWLLDDVAIYDEDIFRSSRRAIGGREFLGRLENSGGRLYPKAETGRRA